MKKIMLITLSFVLFVAGSVNAAMLKFDPGAATVVEGSGFAVHLIVSDLGSDSVGAFDVDILYDTTKMTFTNYTMGFFLGDPDPLLSEAMDLSWGDLGGGRIDLAELSLLPPAELSQPESFSLATLYFNCIALGISTISIDSADPYLTVGDADGYALGPLVIGPDMVINQTPVPEPATMLLMGTGLTGLIASRRKKKA